ncbi:MAG: right-handed parallel beta-helix repeat-containing protein [Candidatus Latescibacteria bacterium]|jgi:hypothetical protein|nr:right-handed parallel beta-helix repeat-containing protein [Candidatus Latescibacterota bacterium]
MEIELTDAGSAAKIQAAIDALPPEGGTVVLPELDIELDRGLQVQSGVTLRGQGASTVLRKGPGRSYPLTGYHNYGMRDVPLVSTDGLSVGMTVSIQAERSRGFYDTFARITWIDNGWVGLSMGLSSDLAADDGPRLTTASPLIFGHNVREVALADLVLDGRRDDQEMPMNSCRGGAIYFYQSRDIEISNVHVDNYHGDGLSHQICRDVRVADSSFNRCSGNGMHPGAGSTNCFYERCSASQNDASGFYFCVRANHITVSECEFESNGPGISIGTRDCYNLITGCRVRDNRGPGVLVRRGPTPVEVHSCVIRDSEIMGNAAADEGPQIAIEAAAHDIAIHDCTIEGTDDGLPGIQMADGVRDVAAVDNTYARCVPVVGGEPLNRFPEITCGYGTAAKADFRHLG